VAGLLVAGLCAVPGSGAFAAADPGMSIAPMPVTPVSLAQAGEVVQWDTTEAPAPGVSRMAEVPASLSGVAVTQVALADSVGFAVTAAGRLVSWGGNQLRLQNIPAEVAATQVTQVATAPSVYAGVVTGAGEVKIWGAKRNFTTPLNVPAGLTGVKQLALNSSRALALRNDGTVVSWGVAGVAPGEPPPGLKATAIALTETTALALTVDGTVVAWGAEPSNLFPVPAALQQPGNVKAIAAAQSGAVAILADGTAFAWGGNAPAPVGTPFKAATSWGLDAVAVVGGANHLGLVDSEGVIHHWEDSTEESGLVPAAVNGRAISQLALGYYGAGLVIVTKMLRGADPQIGGAAVVGQTLTATPGTFSASPETVTSQWLANGAPIPGASGATLTLTAAQLGKAITYKSTATKGGETATSTSAAVTVTSPAVPPVPQVASKTTVTKVTVAKKAKQVSVAGKVTASKSPAGKAKVTIKKGKKVIVTKTVTVSAKGAANLTVKKFATLVAKKLKAKGKKAKTAYRGKYVVTIAYAGNAQVKASNASKGFKIKK
jgi:hypothetical protein